MAGEATVGIDQSCVLQEPRHQAGPSLQRRVPNPALTYQLNQTLLSIDRRLASLEFGAYVRAVDDASFELYPLLRSELGETQARLFLLKISNLLVSKYECTFRHTAVISSPIGLLIDASNSCGLRCPGCVHSANKSVNNFDWPKGILSEATFRKFIEQRGPFAFDVYFANYGEPLLNPLTPKLVEMSRRFLLPSYASSSLSIKRLDVDAVVRSGLNFLIMSIDGVSADVYQRYRRRGNLELVLENVRRLVDAKTRLNSYTPILHWQFLVFEHNAHEIEAVKELSRQLGVNQLALAKPYRVDWDDSSIIVKEDWVSQTLTYDHDRRAYSSAMGKMLENLDTEVIARHFSQSWSDRLEEIGGEQVAANARQDPGGARCTWLYKCATMDSHGRVMPCARPPSSTDNLVFSSHDDDRHFNSEKHRLARQFFADPSRYEAQIEGLPPQDIPWCSQCWHPNTKLDISTEENVRQHLGNISLFNLLSEECKNSLTNW